MTRDETKNAIEVMQAWLDGKPIQQAHRYQGMLPEWYVPIQPVWDWYSFDYRVKPEPREWFICLPSGNACEVPDRKVDTPMNCIHVREVLNE